jgi:hypothetical protein
VLPVRPGLQASDSDYSDDCRLQVWQRSDEFDTCRQIGSRPSRMPVTYAHSPITHTLHGRRARYLHTHTQLLNARYGRATTTSCHSHIYDDCRRLNDVTSTIDIAYRRRSDVRPLLFTFADVKSDVHSVTTAQFTRVSALGS